MPLHLVTGLARTGKTRALDAELARAAASGREAILLVPAYAEVVKARLRLADTCPLGLSIMTFDGWLADEWSLFGDGRRLVSPTLRETLIREALREAGPSAPLADTPGTIRLVAAVATRAARCAFGGSGVAKSIGGVLEDYRRRLCLAGFIEPSHAADELAGVERAGDALLAVDGFPGLDLWQERVLVTASYKSEVWLALPWAEGHHATEALDDTIARLSSVSEHTRLPSPSPSTELDTLAVSLFRSDTAPVASAGRVCFGCAAGEEAERSLAAGIVQRLIDEGFEPGRIAVVMRDFAATRADRLAGELAAEGIEVDIDRAERFEHEPFGRAALALLEVAAGRAGRERLLAYLLSPYSDALPDDVARADVAWRRARVNDPAELLCRAARLGSLTAQAVNAARSAVAGTVTSRSAGSWGRLARSLFACATARAGGSADESRRDAAAHAALLLAVEEALECGEGRVFSSDLLTGLASAPVTVASPNRLSAVQIVRADRLRSEFDAIVVLGLNADGFSGEVRPTPAADLGERLGLGRPVDPRLRERLLFYLVVARARERLYLLRTATNATGESQRASGFWEDVLDAYRSPSGAASQPPPMEALSLTDLALAAPAIREGRRSMRVAADRRRRSLRRRGSLHDPDALAHLSQRREFSVTELEAYLACPYRWFYERMLRPRQIDRDVDARELGAYAHELLARSYRYLWERGRERMTVDVLPEIEAWLAEEAHRLAAERGIGGQSLAEELALASAIEKVGRLLEDDVEYLPGWRPVAVEQPFGGEGSEFEIDGVLLSGRIDRIDTDGQNVVVTDYKNGRGQPGGDGFAKKGVLQPVVYAAAAASLLSAQPAGGVFRSLGDLEVRGFWRADLLSKPTRGKDKDGIDASGWEALLGEARSQVAEAVRGIRAGEIVPRPRNRDSCSFCAISATCTGAIA